MYAKISEYSIIDPAKNVVHEPIATGDPIRANVICIPSKRFPYVNVSKIQLSLIN